ncbi:hypothetical protein HK102_010493, partial [Quaeritorhiza haematococci]
ITDSLQPTHLEIIDDSAKHARHKAMIELGASGETHFRVTIVSDQFEGKLIYQLLDSEIKAGVHALQLTTKTPAEFAKMQQQS